MHSFPNFIEITNHYPIKKGMNVLKHSSLLIFFYKKTKQLAVFSLMLILKNQCLLF